MQAPHRSQSRSSPAPGVTGAQAQGSPPSVWLLLVVIAVLASGLAPTQPPAVDGEPMSTGSALLPQE